MKIRKLYFPVLALLIGSSSSLLVSGNRQTTAIPEKVGEIFRKNCAVSGCHKGKYPPANLNLEPKRLPGTVLDVQSLEIPALMLVASKESQNSYLLKKVRGESGIVGNRMPLERPPLSDQQLEILTSWVQNLKQESTLDVVRPSPYSKTPAFSKSQGLGSSQQFTKPAFWGVRLINLPTTTTASKGEVLFRVAHRFQPKVATGYDTFFGLDGPNFILLSFAIGLSDSLSLSLGRSNLLQEVEFGLDWLTFEQGRTTSLPFSLAFHIGSSLITQTLAGEKLFEPEHIRLFAQASLSYLLSDRISFLLVPSISTHTNPSHWENDRKGTFCLGVGSRWTIFENVSLITEWIPLVSGYKDAARSWGLGLEKRIGGHVFQVFVLNSFGLTTAQYIPGGDLKLSDGNFRLGFNIFRSF